jgi:hypothetical protein
MTKRSRIRIRKGGFWHESYLSREGKWGSWENAVVFTSQDAAEAFAERHGIRNYGLF